MKKVFLLSCLFVIFSLCFAGLKPAITVFNGGSSMTGLSLIGDDIDLHLGFASQSNDATSQTNLTSLVVQLGYKVPLAKDVNGVFGGAYTTASGKASGVSFDSITGFSVIIGVEYKLIDTILIHLYSMPYTSANAKANGVSVTSTYIGSYMEYGLSYLF